VGTISQADATRERLIETYRHNAKHYDLRARLSPVPGYPQHRLRVRAVRALGLRPGDFVVDLACGTGLNFPLVQEAIGPDGRIVGVDLTDAMLARAQARIETNGWRNVSLVQSDAAAFEFTTGADAILSTYALTQVPDSAAVVAHGAAALSEGRRMVVLDLQVADAIPRWLTTVGAAAVRPFAAIDEWMTRRPWETIRAAMQDELTDVSWSEPCFRTAFLGVGSRGRS
jgi:demethylmenaquinone methyltransferase/2-methoxy-6-polyprenyl-1,4-benzoquinol methylase